MISFSLPARVRRITSVYKYCIEDVMFLDNTVKIKLKDGYFTKDNSIAIETKDMEEAIYILKGVTHPQVRKLSVALFSFQCQRGCGHTIQKGQNFIDLGGMKICSLCGSKDN